MDTNASVLGRSKLTTKAASSRSSHKSNSAIMIRCGVWSDPDIRCSVSCFCCSVRSRDFWVASTPLIDKDLYEVKMYFIHWNKARSKLKSCSQRRVVTAPIPPAVWMTLDPKARSIMLLDFIPESIKCSAPSFSCGRHPIIVSWSTLYPVGFMTSSSSRHTFRSPTIIVGRFGRANTVWYSTSSKLTRAVVSPANSDVP